VGTWLTQAEYKDIKVTRDGQTLYAFDPAQGTKGWRLHGGSWNVVDGALRQTGRGENIRAIIGDSNWSEYTLSMKARKISGDEGFLVLFNVKDDNAKSWWNIGGWGNRQHAVEMGGIAGRPVNGKVETGRWYDLRVEVKGDLIKCFLDDQLVQEVGYPSIKALYASAVKARDEVVLKLVNASFEPQPAVIQLNGVSKVKGAARAIVLTSEKSTDENSLAQPNKVAPVSSTVKFTGNTLNHTFPPNSVTVLRLKAQ
jgi:alpha-L-arabinofuranosidase